MPRMNPRTSIRSAPGVAGEGSPGRSRAPASHRWVAEEARCGRVDGWAGACCKKVAESDPSGWNPGYKGLRHMKKDKNCWSGQNRTCHNCPCSLFKFQNHLTKKKKTRHSCPSLGCCLAPRPGWRNRRRNWPRSPATTPPWWSRLSVWVPCPDGQQNKT